MLGAELGQHIVIVGDSLQSTMLLSSMMELLGDAAVTKAAVQGLVLHTGVLSENPGS